MSSRAYRAFFSRRSRCSSYWMVGTRAPSQRVKREREARPACGGGNSSVASASSSIEEADNALPTDIVPEDLARSVAERRAILFAGAGLSMTVGLPSWQELIDHMAAELGADPSEALNGATAYQTLAEYYRLKRGSIGPLRSWMDRKWRVSEEKLHQSTMHKLIVELHF